ncbi:YCF48-related protein [Marinobacter sp. chi1]|uniref:YCF48-related protein n=1 Tax=Marinobacter suaedae TaxID=3057675 RepID=A0ABT8W0A7_9GAMM|nr:YCF48-related protein [Marinobacter sp. chi1]MDO3721650.1 YCF48-related protein [Marinobacter sp. chi1]
MSNYKFGAGLLALVMGSSAQTVWGETPPLEYEISPHHVAIFDISTTDKGNYAVGERGVLLSSSAANPDAWKSQRLPAPQSVMGIAFGTGGHGVAVGHGGVILATTDDGETWTSIDASDHTRGDPFMDVAHLGDNRFLAVGAFGLVMGSDDGGLSWQPVSISEDYFDRHLYTIAQAGGDWLLIGESGSLFVSEDAGNSWSRLESPYEGSFFGGLQTPDGAWLLYGMRGQIWRSEDRGASWQKSPVDTKVAFNAHGIGPGNEVYLFGNGGQVLVSEDDGRHFAPSQRSGMPGDITAASRLNGKWLVGSTAGVRLWQASGE